LLDGDVFQGSGFEAAGVVDQNVEPGEAGDGGVDGGANLLGIAEFGAESGSFDAQGLDLSDGFRGVGF
jgi:hypothetical protein